MEIEFSNEELSFLLGSTKYHIDVYLTREDFNYEDLELQIKLYRKLFVKLTDKQDNPNELQETVRPDGIGTE